ncbi:hypothetical protein COCSUDRAFT_66205 [Coccomyxa subellipsoidea C-169]|uniref:RPA-interacting protein C-terminal domain-containing protein n=1 Tax=Coccomyxa subellipsoidea (strain C-169) TaxID=574566 RepID=I0YXR2_COCSC|nr:hypothetical protein COCSUDRAFT_66205 [Coccomyxa subellipsoidea C-169]EIE23181.1 hypothetical protein COCSUDRAFT_66205 [Coccomyxa subellipsoidea C-169]|eukprot:XP_005647725.1 hypothetical protein COCSUDRAFT_66205 [Coccomyxa subellipsoidea C-169]
MGSTGQQRRSAKALADRAQWRSRVRSECMQRVKDQRADLLWRLRQEGGGGNPQVDVKLVLADIIADVSTADVVHCNPAAGEEPAAAAAPEDSLMDDDFTDTAPQPGKPVPNILDGAFGLGAAEYEELMRSLEESLFEDMRRDEAAFLAEHERWESAAADSDLSMLVDLHAEGPSTSGRIPCPVCRNGHLMEHNGVVLCSGCDLRMDLRVEGLTLDDIRQRLANVLDGHALQGCHRQPRFVLDTALMGDAPSLLMQCEACSSLHVVV